MCCVNNTVLLFFAPRLAWFRIGARLRKSCCSVLVTSRIMVLHCLTEPMTAGNHVMMARQKQPLNQPQRCVWYGHLEIPFLWLLAAACHSKMSVLAAQTGYCTKQQWFSRTAENNTPDNRWFIFQWGAKKRHDPGNVTTDNTFIALMDKMRRSACTIAYFSLCFPWIGASSRMQVCFLKQSTCHVMPRCVTARIHFHMWFFAL